MIRYKIDVYEALKAKGITTTRIRDEKLLPAQTLMNMRQGKSISTDTLNKVCLLLRLQPGDILEEVPTDEEKLKYYDF